MHPAAEMVRIRIIHNHDKEITMHRKAGKLFLACLLAAGSAHADVGKLLLTGGVSSIDGAAGGGITPWAVVGTQATEGQWGVSGFYSKAKTHDYGLSVAGIALGWDDRLEVSLAKQDFDTGRTGDALGLPGLHLRQDIVGVKLRVAGDAIVDSDNWMPQVAVGLLHKRLDAGGLAPVLGALGAKTSGTDFYISATKLMLDKGLLVNGTLRATQSNQNGLLGFGATLGGSETRYRLMPEISVAYLLRRDLAVGAEYRHKPDNLGRAGQLAGLGDGLKEQDWKVIFLAWAPSKNLSLTLAWVDLGQIVGATTESRRQKGAYLSAQVAF
jgi:hypothetical protein